MTPSQMIVLLDVRRGYSPTRHIIGTLESDMRYLKAQGFVVNDDDKTFSFNYKLTAKGHNWQMRY